MYCIRINIILEHVNRQEKAGVNMDRITISNLEVFAYHGVLKEENSLGQKFLISAELYMDTTEASEEDDITKSINYSSVCKEIASFLKGNTFRLIETTANRLAKHLLLKYSRIEKLKLEIKKPWAPILMSLDTVSVVIERGWHDAYLGMGSNMGDRKANLEEAIRMLSEDEECRVAAVSSFITTKPVGYLDQDDFLNGALHLKTLRTPDGLLELIGRIEKALGRERKIHWGPRTIDLDILFYDDETIEKEDLIIPHRELANRDFVLTPLCEIAPWLKHPVLGMTVLQLKDKLNS